MNGREVYMEIYWKEDGEKKSKKLERNDWRKSNAKVGGEEELTM